MEKLYLVELRGLGYEAIGKRYGLSYVVAKNTDEAYLKVRKFLDKEDIGFKRDRELHLVKQIAEEDKYGNLDSMLFL